MGFSRAFFAVLARSLLSWHNLGRLIFLSYAERLSEKWNRLHYWGDKTLPTPNPFLPLLFFLSCFYPSNSLMSFLPLWADRPSLAWWLGACKSGGRWSCGRGGSSGYTNTLELSGPAWSSRDVPQPTLPKNQWVKLGACHLRLGSQALEWSLGWKMAFFVNWFILQNSTCSPTQWYLKATLSRYQSSSGRALLPFPKCVSIPKCYGLWKP